MIHKDFLDKSKDEKRYHEHHGSKDPGDSREHKDFYYIWLLMVRGHRSRSTVSISF